MKVIFKKKSIICGILSVLMCVSLAVAGVAPRTVSGVREFGVDGVTYRLTSHINVASDGGVYGGASCYSDEALPKNYMKVRAILYDASGEGICFSDIVGNASYNKTVTATTERDYSGKVSFSRARALIYDPITGDTITIEGKKTPLN